MTEDIAAPAFAVRALRRVRWAILVAEMAILALAAAGHLEPLPVVPIAATCGALLISDLLQQRLVSAHPRQAHQQVGAHLAVDLLALCVLVALSPDAHQPMQAFFIVEAALAATVLPLAVSMAMAVTVAVLQAASLVVSGAVRADPELPHLASHALLTAFAIVATSWFVTRLADALRVSTNALREAEKTRLATERLAALDASRLPDEPAPVEDIHFTPGWPRTVLASLTVYP